MTRPYTLHLGDCIEAMRNLPAASVDAVVCDPPYGTTRNAWDAVIPLDQMWEQLRRIVKPGGVIVFTASQPFSSALVMSNPGWFRHDWVWEKGNATGFLNAKKAPLRAHETVLVFCSRQPTYNPQMTHGHARKSTKRKTVASECYGQGNQLTVYDSTSRYPRSVQFFSSDKQRSKLHPTQKPLALMEYLVRTYTNAGQVVLDFAMGSGTTGVACANTGRLFVGMEDDAKHFATADARVAHAYELAMPRAAA
jgi:site-specific DNA-methyltransferase (adenine-specific)